MPGRLKRRAEFVRVSRGRRVHGPLLTLQVGPPPEGRAEEAEARFGLTVTKKVGSSPERNRIRRRLRESLRLHGALPVEAGTDYVIVARRALLSAPFQHLGEELEALLRRSVSRKPRPAPRAADADEASVRQPRPCPSTTTP